jgi:Tfp pilus assembly protein PilP
MATRRVQLDRVALLGILSSATRSAALVRQSDGRIARVTVGDEVAGGIVAAIGQDRLILAKRGGDEVLRLPEA